MKSEYEEQVISGQRCEAIKIFYNGVNYKSKLEGKWAAYFNYLGVGFGYEVEDGFPTTAGIYCPDFFIYKTGWFIEVKASPDLLTEREKEKIGYFETHLPEWANGIIIVYGNPENTYDTWFLRDVLGVERTEEEVKNAEYTAINTSFYSGSYNPVAPVYVIDNPIDSGREELVKILYSGDNIRQVAKVALYGTETNVIRKPFVEIKDFTPGYKSAYEAIKKEISEYYVKPYSVDRCVQVCDYSLLLNEPFDVLANICLNGTIRPKLKTSHPSIRRGICPTLPDGRIMQHGIRMYIKIISKIEPFESFFYVIKRSLSRNYPFEFLYVIFTPDTRYKKQFSSIGVSIITPSDIGE
jgi:hypothetical protein